MISSNHSGLKYNSLTPSCPWILVACMLEKRSQYNSWLSISCLLCQSNNKLIPMSKLMLFHCYNSTLLLAENLHSLNLKKKRTKICDIPEYESFISCFSFYFLMNLWFWYHIIFPMAILNKTKIKSWHSEKRSFM